MSRIGAVGGGATIVRARPAQAATDFAVAPEAAAPVVEAMAPARVGVAGLLTETLAGEPTVRDRRARTGAQTVLRALSAVQAAMLGGDAAASLRDLAEALDDVSDADDPRLADAVSQVKLRAAVELARHFDD